MQTGSEGSWSAVGTDAKNLITNLKEPTMVLNLQDLDYIAQKRTVIHMFGHALGLEHEHLRSDFWDTVGEYFDIGKIIKDPRVVQCSESSEDTRARLERDFKKSVIDPDDPPLSEHDPDSIMQYM